MAPEGHHCLNLVTFALYEIADWYWDDPREQYLENQLDLLEKKFGLEDIRDHIMVANNPKDFARMYLHPSGAVYALHIIASTFFRPHLRSKAVPGLYLTSASTHFGGGVPPTIGPG
jgi:phytoene dehydrogenase-like protein